MGLFDEIENLEITSEDIAAFADKVTVICRIIGKAEIESDDHGDRWLSFTHSKHKEIWAEARAKYGSNYKPIWEIKVGDRRDSTKDQEFIMEREDF